jgi:hypothetical protein
MFWEGEITLPESFGHCEKCWRLLIRADSVGGLSGWLRENGHGWCNFWGG